MIDHAFVRPGQVTSGRPARDTCMQCGRSEAQHVVAGLGLDVRILARELSAWSHRDARSAQPGARQSASTAIEAIDRMLASLHAVRQQLVSQIRQFDDAAMARAGALLAECRARREEGQ